MTLPLRSCGIVWLAMKSLVFFFGFALSILARAADAPAAAKSEESRQLLQQGLFEEEANRDFEKAADAYGRLLKEYDHQRALAATALFRLAEIRAKQGNKTEAIALHQRLLAEFANHDPLAKLSRERLATLGGAAPPAADVAAAPTESEASELARVREMVKNSPDLVNAVHVTPNAAPNETPLAFAVKNGWLQVATFLLDHGAALNGLPDSPVPLNVAALGGHKALVELLLARGAKVNGADGDDSALIVACANRRVEVVRLLLERGADPKYATAFGVTALHAACVAKNAEIARILIEKEAPPNVMARRDAKIDGQPVDGTPLYYAVDAQQPELVKLLLDHGADANIPRPLEGRTPLIRAVALRDERMVAILLTHGAKPDLADEEGNTALHYAAQIGAPELPSGAGFMRMPAKDDAARHVILETLAGKGANPNVQNKSGLTPLHYAIGSTNVPPETALWLIEHGADLKLKDKSGATPLQFSAGERRLFFEKRLVFATLIKERAVSALIRSANTAGSETERIESVAEFESPPTLLELLREKFALFIQTAATESAELVIYRNADADTIKEIVRAQLGIDDGSNTLRFGAETDATKWPALRWGDVVVFEGGKTLGNRRARVLDRPAARPGARVLVPNNVPQSDVLPHKPVTVTVQLGERSGQLKIGDRQARSLQPDVALRIWSPAEPVPLWRFSELIEHAIAAEPRAQLEAIKVQRTINGKVQEWIVDMRAGDGVKELPARIGDGDTIIIPLRPASTPEALAKRRTGIFQTASGRILGQQVFRRKNQDGAARTLAEFLMQSYLAGEMIVPLPDFSKISIYRLKGETGEEEKLTIDFTKAISAATDKIAANDARALDVPLQWGDVVEIQQASGSAKQWMGFTRQTVLYLNKALTRVVHVRVNGAEKGGLSLEPEIPNFLQGASERRLPTGRLSPFSVSEILRLSNVALDELVKVTIRSGETVREFTPDQLRAIQPWVQDGDRVEIERL